MTLTTATTAGSTPQVVDLYVVLQLPVPDQTLRFLQADEGLTPAIRTLDGAQEARLVALAYSHAPEGRVSWTLRLLAEKLVELQPFPLMTCESYVTMAADSSIRVSTIRFRLWKRLS
jgi:hypothetical protein